MARLFSTIIVAIAALLAIATAQSTLPICRKVCHQFKGDCNRRLNDLASTRCFDTITEKVRTCDCGIRTLQQLASLNPGTIIRDCVIPQRLFNFRGAITVSAKLSNVHASGIQTSTALHQKGDITGSTMCDWTCFGVDRFNNCRITGNVVNSIFDDLSAEGEATLSFGGQLFRGNKAQFIRSQKAIAIGCEDGFDSNTVQSLTTSGQFSILLSSKMRHNRIDRMTLQKVDSFGNVDGNNAGIVTAQGPCRVLNVVSPIEVEDTLIAADNQCRKLFQKV